MSDMLISFDSRATSCFKRADNTMCFDLSWLFATGVLRRKLEKKNFGETLSLRMVQRCANCPGFCPVDGQVVCGQSPWAVGRGLQRWA